MKNKILHFVHCTIKTKRNAWQVCGKQHIPCLSYESMYLETWKADGSDWGEQLVNGFCSKSRLQYKQPDARPPIPRSSHSPRVICGRKRNPMDFLMSPYRRVAMKTLRVLQPGHASSHKEPHIIHKAPQVCYWALVKTEHLVKTYQVIMQSEWPSWTGQVVRWCGPNSKRGSLQNESCTWDMEVLRRNARLVCIWKLIKVIHLSVY